MRNDVVQPILPTLRNCCHSCHCPGMTQLSLPGLTRQSIHLCKKLLAKKMDARVKPAHDEPQ
jgi:hypothetical protein